MNNNETILKDIEQKLSSISQDIKVYNNVNIIVCKTENLLINISPKLKNRYELKMCNLNSNYIYEPLYYQTIEELIKNIKSVNY